MVPSSALETRSSSLSWFAAALAGAAGLALALLPLSEGALVAAGAAILLSAAIRPDICLYLAAFAVPFGAIRTVDVGGLRAGGVDLAAALFVVSWLAQGVAQRRLILRLPPLTAPLALFLAALVLSLFDTYSLQASVEELAKWGELLVVYVLGASVLGWRRHAGMLVGCLVLAGALEAMVGIYGSLARIGPPSYAILGGLIYRASGDLAQPNPFAGYMNQVWPLALGLLAAAYPIPTAEPDAPTHRWIRLALAAGALALLTALLLSWSRGAWLGAAAAIGAMLLGWTVSLSLSGDSVQRRAGRKVAAWLLCGSLLAAAIGVLGAADILPASVTERLGSITEDIAVIENVRTVKVTDANFAAVERVAHWWAGWQMWEEHPWTGVGIGSYAVAYPQYNLPGWDDALGHAHNFYINIAAETGTVGLAAYLLFVTFALVLAANRLIRAQDGLARGLALAVLGALVARFVQDGLDSLWVHGMGVHAALLLVLLEFAKPAAPLEGTPRPALDCVPDRMHSRSQPSAPEAASRSPH